MKKVRETPLRDRGDDIVQVAKAFLHNYGGEYAKPGLTFAPDSLRALSHHRWPGNVRELQNRVRRAVIMAEGKRVTAKDLELTDTLSTLPPPDAEGSAGTCGTGDDPGRPAPSPGEDRFRRPETWHQPADAL